jgi:PIN domain nuclease of toxin-antitoxin system
VLIWWVAEPSRLDLPTVAALASDANQVMVSSVTAWEIAISQAIGRLKFPLERFDEIIERMGCDILPILPAHGIVAARLPNLHNDPFDRMLIAQALVEELVLVTADAAIRRYEVAVLGAPQR